MPPTARITFESSIAPTVGTDGVVIVGPPALQGEDGLPAGLRSNVDSPISKDVDVGGARRAVSGSVCRTVDGKTCLGADGASVVTAGAIKGAPSELRLGVLTIHDGSRHRRHSSVVRSGGAGPRQLARHGWLAGANGTSHVTTVPPSGRSAIEKVPPRASARASMLSMPLDRWPGGGVVADAVVGDAQRETTRGHGDGDVDSRRAGVPGDVRQRLTQTQQQVPATCSSTALSIGPSMSSDGLKPRALAGVIADRDDVGAHALLGGSQADGARRSSTAPGGSTCRFRPPSA